MHRLFVTAAFLALATPAAAQEVPRYDPPGYCQSVADAIGGSAQIKSACLQQEQSAYDRLKVRWIDFPRQTRTYCDEVSRAIGGTYQILAACIEQELSAAADMPDFEF